MTVRRWLEGAAEPLKVRAGQVGWRRTVERDPQRAMEHVRPGSMSRTAVLEHRPGVGPIGLAGERGLAVELKRCKSGDGLCNSA